MFIAISIIPAIIKNIKKNKRIFSIVVKFFSLFLKLEKIKKAIEIKTKNLTVVYPRSKEIIVITDVKTNPKKNVKVNNKIKLKGYLFLKKYIAKNKIKSKIKANPLIGSAIL